MSSTKKIRVAQIIGLVAEGGVESCIMNYYKNIDRDKVQFDFFIEEGAVSKIIIPEKIKSMGGRVIYIPKLKNILLNDRKLVKLLKAGEYDIVHANKTTLNCFYLRAAKKAGIKIRISHAHSTTNKKEFFRNLVKNFFKFFSKKYATNYFACSEYAGRWLFGNKAFDDGKVAVINNAIDLARYKFEPEIRSEIRNELGVENKFVVGHVGRFMEQKNHMFLLDVFYEIQKRKPDSVLLLIGDGPLHEKITERAKALGVEAKVVFCGVHKHPERYYQAMDVFLLPSLYEGLGMVLIEAQVNGLHCFASTEVPIESKILDSTSYFDLKLGADAWAQGINVFSETTMPEKYEEERKSAYKYFIGLKYDIKSEAQKLLSRYEEMMNGK